MGGYIRAVVQGVYIPLEIHKLLYFTVEILVRTPFRSKLDPRGPTCFSREIRTILCEIRWWTKKIVFTTPLSDGIFWVRAWREHQIEMHVRYTCNRVDCVLGLNQNPGGFLVCPLRKVLFSGSTMCMAEFACSVWHYLSTHNICFGWEIGKKFCYALLSVRLKSYLHWAVLSHILGSSQNWTSFRGYFYVF